MSGGIMPCRASGSGGLMPCGECYDLDSFRRPMRTKLYYVHVSVEEEEELEKRLIKLGNSDKVLKKGSTEADIFFNNEVLNSRHKLTRIDKIAELLFEGARYYSIIGENDGSDIYRFGEIPNFPQIRLASIQLPNNNEDIKQTEAPACLRGDHFHDYSLDIILFGQKDFSLRVPLLMNDRRIPEEKESENKYGHIFLARGFEVKHYRSYCSKHSLQRGLKRAILRFGEVQK